MKGIVDTSVVGDQMETRVLRYFLKIAELGNITKAAEELHVTQPTLSRQLKNLEDSIGQPLFIREKRKLVLTNAGIIYQQRVKQILADIDKLNRDIQQQDIINGVISIGCVESTIAKFLTEMISRFHLLYPEVRFELYSGDGDDIKEKLDRNMLDLGFLLSPVEIAKYNYRELTTLDRWGILVPQDSTLAKKDGIGILELASLPLIMPQRKIVKDEIHSWLNIPEASLRIIGSHNLLTNALDLVRQEVGYVVCTYGSYMNRPVSDLEFRPIYGVKEIEHALIWKKNIPLSELVKKFRDFILENDTEIKTKN